MQSGRVCIIGAHGQLGHDLVRILAPEFEVVGLDHDDVDISDYNAVAKKMSDVSPALVVNVAAYNKVEEAETHAALAYGVNAIGAHNIARTAAALGIPVLHISTDYVFSGTEEDGYTEDDQPHPMNVYGASKEAGETLVRIANPKHWIIRTSALFGVNAGGGKGYNFVSLMRARGGEGAVRVVGDQWTVPTYTNDLAQGLKQLLIKDVPFGTYHLSSEGSTTWYQFAEEIFRLSHMSPLMKKITTLESGTKIPRPTHSILRNTKLKALGITLPTWQSGLSRYIEEITK